MDKNQIFIEKKISDQENNDVILLYVEPRYYKRKYYLVNE